jgi:hypothetical protein
MCDEFENVDQLIFSDVAGVAAQCGLTLERSEVVESLRALVEKRLAKAYKPFRSHSRSLLGRTSGYAAARRP